MKLKKIVALMLAVIMCMAMSTTVFAANDGTIEVKNTHKGQVYELYQLFDATTVAGREDNGEGISYKLMSGKTDFKATVEGTVVDGAQWFKLDEGGNVVIKDNTAQAAITDDNADFAAWAKAYGVKNATTKEASADNAEVKWEGLAEGYYFITTTTGSLVTIDSIKPNVEVEDKNPGTTIDKTITDANSMDEAGKNALAQVGTDVDYESRIPISRGAYNYKFTDVMSDGLTLKADSVKVYLVEKDAAVADGASDVNAACGTIAAENKTGEDADITITFDDAWLKTNWGKDIVIQYTATVNKDAIIADAANPNTAKIEYGNEDKPLTDEDEAKVYSAKVTIKKIDGDGNALEGAGFKLKNAEGKWYKNTNGIVSWEDTEAAGTEIFPVKGKTTVPNPEYDADAAAADPDYSVPATIETDGTDAIASFDGLADGTYTIVETTVPEGYNKAEDKEITIKPADTNNLTTELNVQSEVTNQSGSELPSTGGMGTHIFYLVGTVLVLGAGIILVSRKRAASK